MTPSCGRERVSAGEDVCALPGETRDKERELGHHFGDRQTGQGSEELHEDEVGDEDHPGQGGIAGHGPPQGHPLRCRPKDPRPVHGEVHAGADQPSTDHTPQQGAGDRHER